MKVLIHICCAGCFAKCLAGLRGEFGDALEPRGFWYNPNIHPLLEYRRRLKAVKVYLERDPVLVDYLDPYGLVEFLNVLDGAYQAPERCRRCYAMRLRQAARHAAEQEIPYVTSTLVTSAHQNHDDIRAAGEAAARDFGVTFLYRDLRAAEPDPKLVQGLYKQSYCGCVFSEEERYRTTSKHLYARERMIKTNWTDLRGAM